MTLQNLRDEKLHQAKEILTELGIPSNKINDRSGWVLLALANIKPTDLWINASAPLLRTVEIMEKIRVDYGVDYKPNSRESIRKGTIQFFEQAGLVSRNRDKPGRATNSGLNNYSLNVAVLEILHQYPDGDWLGKIQEKQDEILNLVELYAKVLELLKVPITLLDGSVITISPGKHNQLHADIIHEFCPRFIGEGGKLLYLGDTSSSRNEGGKLMILESEYLTNLGVPPMSHDMLPDVIVFDEKRNWLFLIEAVASTGPISPKRWNDLEKALIDCKVDRVYVTAFPDRYEFRKHVTDIAWDTEVWIADNPDHMIHFNGEKFLGPYKRN